MKRIGNIWQDIISQENFILAQKKSRKNKTNRYDVIRFEKELEKNLEEVRQLVITKQFTTSPYRTRTIYEPKERIIYILPYAPDRIVQHAIMNVIVPIMERLFISDSYACIDGKGQIKASQRTMQAVRRNKYCLKCDIRKFYPSINQNILSDMYHKKFKDKDFLQIMDDIIFSFPGGFNCPIGNYTSQWSGNFYLTPLDNFCKHQLKIKDYLRYCDDFLLFSDDKTYLHECRKRIEEFIGTKLGLQYSKSSVFNVKQGIDFVGYRHFNNYILVRKSTYKRQKQKIKELPLMYERGEITKDKMRSVIDSIYGWTKHANAYNFRQAIKIDEIRREYCA